VRNLYPYLVNLIQRFRIRTTRITQIFRLSTRVDRSFNLIQMARRLNITALLKISCVVTK